eukprot:jgi/Chlat1/352/Chrsp10S01473
MASSVGTAAATAALAVSAVPAGPSSSSLSSSSRRHRPASSPARLSRTPAARQRLLYYSSSPPRCNCHISSSSSSSPQPSQQQPASPQQHPSRASHVRPPDAVAAHTTLADTTSHPLYSPSDDDIDTLPPIDINALYQTPLPSHPKLIRGTLDNGLKYVVLPNPVPPSRFEAHLEIGVGSVDEEDDQQGLAHLIEHVTFLGSRKRERLLGTGGRSNAYTDFHHTVFHAHMALTDESTGAELLPATLDALAEIAFEPQFLPSRIEKERRAVLSELQMMNTMEYRVDCQLLHHLHSENKLSCRCPIGLEEQIKQWGAAELKEFHRNWYFPANATLFLVGDFPSVPHVISLIHSSFGRISADPGSVAAAAEALEADIVVGLMEISSPNTSTDTTINRPPPQPTPTRPPVMHTYSTQHLPPVSPNMFKHPLLQQFTLSLMAKDPVVKVDNLGELRRVLMSRIVVAAFQFRINTRYKMANPPFSSIDLDRSDSAREGCAVTALTIVAEPNEWKGAVQVAVHEARRLFVHGVTASEQARYLSALLKDSDQLAAMVGQIPSLDNLDFVMESDALGHTVMDQVQGHQVADTLTLDEVNAVARELLAFVADFNEPHAPKASAVVACVPQHQQQHANATETPATFDVSAQDILDAIEEAKAIETLAEPDLVVPRALISDEQLSTLIHNSTFSFADMGDGTDIAHDEATGIVQRRLHNGIKVNYKQTSNEARGGAMRLVAAGGRALEPKDAIGCVAVGTRTLSEGGAVGRFSREEVELFCVSNLVNCVVEADEEFLCMDFHFSSQPSALSAAFQVLHLVLEQPVWSADALERAKQLYASHWRGIPKSLERATANRLMRAMFGGDGRLLDPSPSEVAALTLEGVQRAVMEQLVTDNVEIDIVGDFDPAELERCILTYLGTVKPRLGNSSHLQKQEKLSISSSVPASSRRQRLYLRDSDERACAYLAGRAPNRWGYLDIGERSDTGPSRDDISENPEATVGAIEEGRTDVGTATTSSSSSTYVGTCADVKDNIVDLNVALSYAPAEATPEQLAALGSGIEVRWDERAGKHVLVRPRHPLWAAVSMGLLTEVVNARLFTTVRDAMGLTYDVGFELSLFDRLNTGWFVVSVTSTPAKIEEALQASVSVLRGIKSSPVTHRELERAKRTLLTRHESDLKDNNYWLGLLTHLQADSVPRKSVGCVRDMPWLYENATVQDVQEIYDALDLRDEAIFTSVGVAGRRDPSDAGDIDPADFVDAQRIDEEIGDDLEDDVNTPHLDAFPGAMTSHGRGRSMVTLPTTDAL